MFCGPIVKRLPVLLLVLLSVQQSIQQSAQPVQVRITEGAYNIHENDAFPSVAVASPGDACAVNKYNVDSQLTPTDYIVPNRSVENSNNFCSAKIADRKAATVLFGGAYQIETDQGTSSFYVTLTRKHAIPVNLACSVHLTQRSASVDFAADSCTVTAIEGSPPNGVLPGTVEIVPQRQQCLATWPKVVEEEQKKTYQLVMKVMATYPPDNTNTYVGYVQYYNVTVGDVCRPPRNSSELGVGAISGIAIGATFIVVLSIAAIAIAAFLVYLKVFREEPGSDTKNLTANEEKPAAD